MTEQTILNDIKLFQEYKEQILLLGLSAMDEYVDNIDGDWLENW
jgi:hypothetical protein